MHGDPGPFNTIFQKGLPVALIDWSSCRPGNRLDRRRDEFQDRPGHRWTLQRRLMARSPVSMIGDGAFPQVGGTGFEPVTPRLQGSPREGGTSGDSGSHLGERSAMFLDRPRSSWAVVTQIVTQWERPGRAPDRRSCQARVQ
ncbi:hypothetical protein ACIBO2_36940 [Nonomuraea sp. NPDC050022]|uniref:hypothetical protein n=1 Tax=unclassified Nonomuraea TaxID=2593643 RepID=UPI0033C36CBE